MVHQLTELGQTGRTSGGAGHLNAKASEMVGDR